jgi:hypothetical protein
VIAYTNALPVVVGKRKEDAKETSYDKQRQAKAREILKHYNPRVLRSKNIK